MFVYWDWNRWMVGALFRLLRDVPSMSFCVGPLAVEFVHRSYP